MAKRIDGILFDLGDTLLDFGPVDIHTMFEEGARLAYEFLKQLGKPLPSFAHYHRNQLWAIRWNYFKSHFTRREFNSLELIGRLSRRMEHDLTREHVLELAWLWYKPLRGCATMENGAADMLRRFRDAGLKLGVVSNTFVPGEVLDRHLKEEGLLEFLPTRIYSCNVGYRKPHRKIFAKAVDQAGLTADGTIFVGDSPKADIRGARDFGMISVLKDPHDKHAAAAISPDHRIRRLAELEQIVAGYNS